MLVVPDEEVQRRRPVPAARDERLPYLYRLVELSLLIHRQRNVLLGRIAMRRVAETTVGIDSLPEGVDSRHQHAALQMFQTLALYGPGSTAQRHPRCARKTSSDAPGTARLWDSLGISGAKNR